MYQLLIEDKNNNVRYVSSIVISEKELSEFNMKLLAQNEHIQRNPDDKMLDEQYLNNIFMNIDIIGLVPVQYKEINV